MAKESGEQQSAPRPKRHRSPNYPAINLKEAVELISKIHATYKRQPVPPSLLHKMWEMKEQSSLGAQKIAALLAFGLAEYSGSGEDRRILVSQMGDHIARSGPNRGDDLQKAALLPAIFKELWEKRVEGELPHDDLMKRYLVWDRPESPFNENTVDLVIAKFKESVRYAGLLLRDKIEYLSSDRETSDQTAGTGHDDSGARHAERSRIKRDTTVSKVYREEVFLVPEGGEIVLQVPSSLSKETFADFQDWLKIAVRKIGRLVTEDRPERTDDASE